MKVSNIVLEPVNGRTSAWDWVGLGMLGLLVVAAPVVYLNAEMGMEWIVEPIGILAVVANANKIRIGTWHGAIVCLVATWLLYFLSVIVTSSDTGIIAALIVAGKWTGLAVLLSLLVRRKVQMVVVLGAMCVSVIVVMFLSRVMLQDASFAAAKAVTDTELGSARTAGVYHNANTMGIFAVSAAACAIVILNWVKSRLKWGLCIPAILAAGILARYSGSRKAVIGMVALCLLIAWTLASTKRKGGNLFAIIIAATVLAAGALWLRGDPFLSRFDRNEGSYTTRVELLEVAWDSWRDAPLMGQGYAGFTRKFGTYSHSSVTEALYNGGLVGLALFAGFWALTFRKIAKCVAMERDPWEQTALRLLRSLCVILFIFSVLCVLMEEVTLLIIIGPLSGYVSYREQYLRKMTSLHQFPG